MKTTFKISIFSSFIGILIQLNVFAQSNNTSNNMQTGCATDNITTQNQNFSMQSSSGTNCSKSSTDWTAKYKLQTHYIPSTNFEAVKTIPINIVIFGEDDPNGIQNNSTGFPITPSDVATDLSNYQIWLNVAYAQTQNTTCPPMNPAYLPDSKVRFVIKQFYFYNNSAVLNNATSSQSLAAATYHFQQNPDAINQINCYYVKTFFLSGAAGWANTMNYNGNVIPYVMSGSNFTDYTSPFQGIYFYLESHLPHELGHTLSLHHTYNSETLNPSNPDFLDDVFANPPSYFMCDNVMGGASTNEFISPKQMGRMHRSLSTDYNTLLQYNIRHYAYGYSAIPNVITGNETWDFTYKSYNNIVVKKGATLTLTCRLEMVKEAAIIVEQGGLLIVDGATITSARSAGHEHEGLWQGIKVWGTNNKSQYQLDPQGFYYQGRVEVRNGAVIENAEVAIEANRPGYWINGGGIIKIVGSTIRNCWKGVHFTMYTQANSASYIRNSTFETTADLINGDVPQSFIEGWAFKGLRVNGCTFRNTNPNATSINQLGKGIYLESAKGIIAGSTTATVTDFCDETNPNWQPNIFENLYKGVELVNYGMQQTNGIFTSSVTRNYFKNCVYGVECKGMPAVSINQNKIVLGANSVYNNYNEGITHKSYTGFSISENCVSQVGTNAAYTGGIIITEVGGDNNQVYRNFSFDNEHAYLSNGKNRTAAPTNQKFKGLQFLCNQNNGAQQYDIAIEGDGNSPTNPMNGIRYYQGGTGNSQNPYSAGNLFTQYCPTSESDIYNNTTNAIVYYHGSNVSEIPSCYSWNVTNSGTTSNSCPTKFGPHQIGGLLSSSQKNVLLADFAIKNSQYLAAALLYNNIIDNGNTQSLLNSISTSFPTDATDLKSLMISNSPNLSDIVVQDLIKESTILQNSDLLSIIAANPDIAHNEELLSMLKEKTNPMDEWMIEFLRESGTYETNRTLLEQTFAQKQYERDEIAWEMVRHILSDTIIDSLNHAELHQWLNIIGSPRAKYMIADDFASMGEFSSASEVLNNINERNLDRYEIMELQGIKSWLELQNTLFNEGRNIYELTSAELELIRPYAENERMFGLAGTFAANVLNHYEPESYVLPTIYPESNKSVSNNETKPKRTLKKLGVNDLHTKSELPVYPNPVNNQLNIDLTHVEEAISLSVYSLKGDLILTQSVQNDKLVKLNTSVLANGSYTLEVKDDKGNTLKSEKLIVNHN